MNMSNLETPFEELYKQDLTIYSLEKLESIQKIYKWRLQNICNEIYKNEFNLNFDLNKALLYKQNCFDFLQKVDNEIKDKLKERKSENEQKISIIDNMLITACIITGICFIIVVIVIICFVYYNSTK